MMIIIKCSITKKIYARLLQDKSTGDLISEFCEANEFADNDDSSVNECIVDESFNESVDDEYKIFLGYCY